jgi:mannosyltransferase OCH1-like enzyme
MEKIIHQIWIGPYEISDIESKWSNEIKNSHLDFTYMFWNNYNFPKLPDNLEKLKNDYQDNCEWIKIADMLRYYLVYEYGGLYLDTDYKLINPIHELEIDKYDGFLPLHFTMGTYENPTHGEPICNSIFGFYKKHPIMKYICDNIDNNSYWLGPDFFSKYIKRYLKLHQYTIDEIVSDKISELNIKTIHSRKELKAKYLSHNSSYNWNPDNQKKLNIDKNFSRL